MPPASPKRNAGIHLTGPWHLLLGLVLAAGCGGTPEEEMTAEEWIGEYVRNNTILLEQLRSFDKKEQQEGINRFLELGKERGSAVVVTLLKDPGLDSYRIEVVLARLLAEWKDEQAIPFLLMHLKGTGTGMNETIKEGLLVFGDHPEIMKAMEEFINDPDEVIRRTAVEILSDESMRGRKALDLLGKRFQVEEELEIRGLCLLGIISNRREAGRTEYLVNALNDSDLDIRQQAWEVISRMKPPARFDPRGAPAERVKAIETLRPWAQARGGGPVSNRQNAAR